MIEVECSCGSKFCDGLLTIFPDKDKKGKKYLVIGTSDNGDSTEIYITFEQAKNLILDLAVKLGDWENEDTWEK